MVEVVLCFDHLNQDFLIDDSFLYERGVRDFAQYSVDPAKTLMPDFFVPADSVPPPGVTVG